MSEKKLWGGRFTKSTDSFTDHFTAQYLLTAECTKKIF